MPASSLLKLATSACVRNIDAIIDVGEAPYNVVRPILSKVKSPKQLEAIEAASPQILGHDAELWRAFIKRDVPQWEKKRAEPSNPKNWSKVYRKLYKEGQAEVDKDIAVLRAKMSAIKDDKAQHTSKPLDPKSISVSELKRVTRIGGGVRRHGNGSARTENNSSLTFTSGSKTKTGTGRDVLNKARREAKEMSLFSVRKSILATPTHRLTDKATLVRSAPKGLVDDYQKPAAKTLPSAIAKPGMIIPPRKSSTTVSTNDTRSTASQAQAPNSNTQRPTTTSTAPTMSEAERERRLRALTAPKSDPRNNSSLSQPPTSSTEHSQRTSPLRAPSLGKDYSPVDKANHAPFTNAYQQAAYKAPRIKPPSPPLRAIKKKAEVDPFIPVKRRRVV